jgi:lipopolysaccharide biosynthesis glycosyltransferase
MLTDPVDRARPVRGDGRLSLVTACDDRYVEGALALLGSLGLCSGSLDRIDIVVLAYCLDASDVRRLTRVADALETPLSVVALKREWAGTVSRYGSPAASARLLIPRLLGEQGPVLYVDADLVFLRCPVMILADVLALPTAALYAVRDVCTPLHGSPHGLCGRVHGLDPGAPYFNSGLLLFGDLARWQHHAWADLALRLIGTEPALEYPDQDALNIVLRGRWTPLDPRWNVVPVAEMLRLWRIRRLGPHCPSVRDLTALNDEAYALHFVTEEKPWHDAFPPGCNRDRWLRAREHAAELASLRSGPHRRAV